MTPEEHYNVITDDNTILLTKTTAALNEVALSNHNVRGQYFLTVVFATIISIQVTRMGLPAVTTSK